jgi:hypothetical protein
MSNIFIHPEYKKRLSEVDQQYLLNMIDNDEDFFPIRMDNHDDGACRAYYINVNTNSEHFNKIFNASYSLNYDPFPVKKKNDLLAFNYGPEENPFPCPRELFGIMHTLTVYDRRKSV